MMLKFARAAICVFDAFFVGDELPFASRPRVHLPDGHLEIAARAPLHCLIAIDERLKDARGRSGYLDLADNGVLVGRDSGCGHWLLLRGI
jgi:hypothetical protein